jgi:hypothetical protein
MRLTFAIFSRLEAVCDRFRLIILSRLPFLPLHMPLLHQNPWNSPPRHKLRNRNHPTRQHNVPPSAALITLDARQRQPSDLSGADPDDDRELVEDPDGAGVRGDEVIGRCF